MRTPLGLGLVLALTMTACHDSPVAPTRPPDYAAPAERTAFDLSPFVGVWKLTLRLTEVTGGGGCVLDAMQAQMGVPSPYLLTVAPGAVTLTNPSGDYACTFDSLLTDSRGFTTRGVPGTFTCVKPTMAIRCADGTMHELFSMGSDIDARLLSDGTITGRWSSDFYYDLSGEVAITAEFTGIR